MVTAHASAVRRFANWTPLATLRGFLILFALALGVHAEAETDIWGHLRFGTDILDSGRLPLQDPYSFTSTQPWVNHEWLSQALLALAYRIGGNPTLAAYRAVVTAAFLGVLYATLRRTSWPLRDLLLVACVFAASPVLGSVRPQIHSIPLYALVLAGLSAEARWLPIIFAVWANLHGGWMLGLGAVLIWAICQPTKERLAIFAMCSAATLINPYGVGLWLSLLDAVRRGWSDVSEWQSIAVLSLGTREAVIWVMVAGFVVWAARHCRPTAFEAIWTLMVAIAAFRVRRHVPFFAVTATMLLGARLIGPGPRLSEDRWTRQAVAAVGLVAAILAVTAGNLVWTTATCLPVRNDPGTRPEASAVAFIRAHQLRGRVLMWFDWGLYAVWHAHDLLRVSIDNRRETVYSDEVVEDHRRFYAGNDPDYPKRIGADYVWLPATLGVVEQLKQRGWFVVYRGSRSVILSLREMPLFTAGSEGPASCFPAP